MLESIPWPLIIWAGAGLTALYLLGGAFRKPQGKARRLLVNAMGGLAASWGIHLVAGLFGVRTSINMAVLGVSTLLGIPGAALVNVLAWVL